MKLFKFEDPDANPQQQQQRRSLNIPLRRPQMRFGLRERRIG